MSYSATMPPTMTESVRHNWGWFLVLGIVFILGGIFAIAAPFIATLFVTVFIGASLAVAGVVQIIHAWRMRSWSGFLWQLLVGVIILAGGIAIYWNPFVGALTLTLFVAAMFVVKGIFQLMLAFRVRPHDGWGWLAASGVIALIVGVLIYSGWPFSAVYALGTLAGISLIFSGWAYVMISLAARRLAA
jgi:uncharacterized membrane protein HdeD (DUF308 family)